MTAQDPGSLLILEGLTIGDNDRKIVVGIDFGTTFSGVAWAESRRVSPQAS